MQKRMTMVLAALMILACAAVAVWPLSVPAAHADIGIDRANPFEGMYLHIVDMSEHSTAVKDARLTKGDGVTFLVGTSFDPFEMDWRIGATIWIPMNRIDQIVAFDDLDVLMERFQRVDF